MEMSDHIGKTVEYVLTGDTYEVTDFNGFKLELVAVNPDTASTSIRYVNESRFENGPFSPE